MEHRDIPRGERHGLVNWSYANASARTNATGLVATDIDKVAIQADDDSLWILKALSPVTWKRLDAPGTSSAEGDPYLSSTVLILNALGDDGSQVATDSSPKNKTMTVVRNAAISVLPNGERTFVFTGGPVSTGDSIRRLNDDDFRFPGDFTIEMEYVPSVTNITAPLFDSRSTGGGELTGFTFYQDTALKFNIYSGGGRMTSSFNVEAGRNYHILIQRWGGAFDCFVDGVRMGPTWYTTQNFSDGNVYLGGSVDSNLTSIIGQLGPVRITKGVARIKRFRQFPVT